LDNIRSAYNVGSIFRTADAAGVSKIFLCGITPTPTDRFGRPRNDLAKTALGAEKSVAWESCRSTAAAVRKLKAGGAKIIAVEKIEKTAGAVNYKKVRVTGDTAFVFGNEVKGLSAHLLKKCDLVCEIPMTGRKESLNVAVSAAVVLYRVLNL